MKKHTFYKILVLVILNVMVISLGVATYATEIETLNRVTPRWTTLSTCAYEFEKEGQTIWCGAGTGVPLNVYAYAKYELQYFVNNTWRTYTSNETTGHMNANVEDQVSVTPGYTYRLYVEHKALDANGNVLETESYYSDEYIVVL